MPTPRADTYEKALTALFQADGYNRLAPRTWVQSGDGLVWRGLFITFANRGRLIAQPCLAVYCPAASEIVERGLRNIYRPEARDRSKLGRPILIHVLYDRILRHHGEDRHSCSYDIGSIDQVDEAAKLVYRDFLKAADGFFGHIRSLPDLRDEVKARPTSTGAGMDAMALGYLIDRQTSAQEIDSCVRITPNPMTTEFAAYFKAEIGLAKT